MRIPGWLIKKTLDLIIRIVYRLVSGRRRGEPPDRPARPGKSPKPPRKE